jgi:serine/threonine-protein kinase
VTAPEVIGNVSRPVRIQPFGPYDLIERVGVGSIGEVYRAIIRSTGQQVALKRLMPFVGAEADVIEALHGEANLARALDHRCIAKVVDVGDVRGTHYIAYEYVHGRDLRALRDRATKRGESIPLDVGIHVIAEVAQALAHAHGRRDATGRLLGLVHRDVCPSNILVAFDGAVKLSDFGIARAEGRVGRTAAGQVKGTIGYMSPEQVAGREVDGRSDLYALGVCLWELCTGTRLFDGLPALVVMERIASGDVPAPRSLAPGIPADLEAIVVKSLAHSPAQRYPGAEDFHAALSQVARRLGQLADTTRVAQYVRNLFPEAAAHRAATVVPDGARELGPWQECLTMADSKGGSDLDVFEGLAKKSSRSVPPGLTPPPPSTGPRQRTLVGGLSGALPPPPTSTSTPHPLPPPSMPKPSGGALPPPASGPTSGRPSMPMPMPPPPSGRLSSGSLPAAAMPPSRTSVAPNLGSLPPPTITPMRPPAALPPPSMPRPPTATPLPAPPATLRPNDQAVPPPAADRSLATALGVEGGKKSGGKSSVDMDWDDEEESTHVYDKQQHGDVSPKVRPAAGTPAPPRVNAAAALLASSGATAKSAVSMQQTMQMPQGPATLPAGPQSGHVPMPMPPPMHPQGGQQAYAPAQQHQQSSRDEPTSLRVRPPPAQGSSKAGLVLGLIALFAVIGMGVFMFFPRSGQFKIDIKSKSGSPVAKAEIFIDGQKKCDTAPCVVSELAPGPKTIKVIAPDAAPTDVTETVEAGKEKLVFITIDGAAAGAASAGGTGIKAVGNQPGVKVLVDGADKGPLPVELKDLAPGSHKVRFEGDRYAPKEETVEVVANQMKDLGAVQLKVLKGTLTLELATAGASVTLTGQGAKKEKKTLDSVLKVGTPVKLSDIDATQTWKLQAVKKGLADFVQEINFEDGQPEKSIRIELGEPGKPTAVAAAAAPPSPAAVAAAAAAKEARDAAKADKANAAPAAGGSGTLNINSIPVSKVVLDGRPLGSTPKVGVSVPAGNHTVTFIHPELGKKSVTVAVKPGETKTAAVKFK